MMSDHLWDKHGDRDLFVNASKFIKPIQQGHIIDMLMATELQLRTDPRGLTFYSVQEVTLPFTVGSQGEYNSTGFFLKNYFDIIFELDISLALRH